MDLSVLNLSRRSALPLLSFFLVFLFASVANAQPVEVVAWGNNVVGQTEVPAGLTDVIQIAAGGNHSLALKADGTVVGWGRNFYGEIDIPEGLDDVVQIVAGGQHTVALKSDGTVVAWGGFMDQIDVPEGLADVVQVAAGGQFAVALRSDGTVVAWGANSLGALDIPPDLAGVVQVSAGPFHVVALLEDSTVVSWGNNSEDQVPPGLDNIVQIAAGGQNAGLTSDGDVVTWGFVSHPPPPQATSLVQIAAGTFFTVAIRSDSTVVIWGNNVEDPLEVPDGLNGVFQVAAGNGHVVALRRTTATRVEEQENLHRHVLLEQNYPNPAATSTSIPFWLPARTHLELSVFDATGRELIRRVLSDASAGRHQVELDVRSFPSGIYFFQIRAGSSTSARKMIVLK